MLLISTLQQRCLHAAAQAAKLYTEAGQFNPHAARTQRKQARKLQRRRVDTRSSGGAADDFDFAEAFQEVAVHSEDEEEEEQQR